MGTRRKAVSIAFTGAAVATGTLVPGHAQASSTTWHVKNNGTGYHGNLKAVLTSGNRLAYSDTTRHTIILCSTTHASMSVPTSTVIGNPARLGTFTVSARNCVLLGLAFAKHTSRPASLVVSSYKSGVTKGKIENYHSVSSGVGNNCHATRSGSLPFSYVNATHQLNINPGKAATLTTITAVNCPLAPGDKYAVYGTLNITSPTGLTISAT